MIIEDLTREQMIEFIKTYCVKVIKDIPNTNFKAGQWYQINCDEGGVSLIDDAGEWVDIYEFIHDPGDFNKYFEERNTE